MSSQESSQLFLACFFECWQFLQFLQLLVSATPDRLADNVGFSSVTLLPLSSKLSIGLSIIAASSSSETSMMVSGVSHNCFYYTSKPECAMYLENFHNVIGKVGGETKFF
jgi:hypothetical protein